MLYGAAYYHEYQPVERLAEDARLMAEAGLTVVRLGESTWASWEPSDGQFEFAWMDRTIDVLHAHGLNVLLGTPTYAIPPWLARQHPQIMAQYGQGKRAYYGGRQNMNFTDPVFRSYAERIITQIVRHYASHPAVIGYQVDNETSSGPLHNPNVIAGFVDHLRKRFGTVDRLNELWGLTYWSHRLGGWEDLWTPDGNTNPGYNLEWRRFQSSLVTEYLAWHADIVRRDARPDQFVTQNVVPMHGRPESDVYAISQTMDCLAINPYHATQDDLDLSLPPADVTATPDWLNRSSDHPGVWTIALNGDFAYGATKTNYLITELNASSIGWSHTNYPAYDGQWRLVAFTHIARGAAMVAYWHWHTLHYGNEMYWGGILNHDLEPGRCYAEIARIAHEIRDHDAILSVLKPDADMAFLYGQDSKYAFESMPPLSLNGTTEPDPHSYQTIFDTFFRGFFEARAQAVIVHPAQDFERYPLLVVPALYTADDALLDRLVNYARAGGHLLLTFRSGYADEFGRARWQRAPGPLRAAVGASYHEYSNLLAELALTPGQAAFALPSDARALSWADGLVLEGATALAQYDHPHFGRFPAIVSQEFGKGRVTYCGTLPNRPLAAALARWALDQAGIAVVGPEYPSAVRVNTATANSGERLYFIANWSWHTQTLFAPCSGRSLFSNTTFHANAALNLGAWDLEIIVSPTVTPTSLSS